MDAFQKLQDLDHSYQLLKNAERRAEELSSQIPKARVYVAVSGTDIGFEQIPLANKFGLIRRVTNPPGIIHVCRAADLSRTDYLAVARYSSSVRAELALGEEDTGDIGPLLDVGYHFAALLKLRNHTNLLCPCFATTSWDLVSGVKENSISFGLLDDVPKRVRGTDLEPVTVADIEWVNRVWETALDLRDPQDSRRFGLAFNIAYAWNQTDSPRVAIANLWCGVEALFGDKSDRPVTRRIVERICTWIPSLDSAEVEESYNRRCDAVHGRWMEHEIWESVYRAEEILRQGLLTCIDRASVPLPDWGR